MRVSPWKLKELKERWQLKVTNKLESHWTGCFFTHAHVSKAVQGSPGSKVGLVPIQRLTLQEPSASAISSHSLLSSSESPHVFLDHKATSWTFLACKTNLVKWMCLKVLASRWVTILWAQSSSEFFSFWPHPQHEKIPGQGLNLYFSSDNTRFLKC